MGRLEGNLVIIAGAGSGIGKASVHLFAKEDVFVTGVALPVDGRFMAG